jgi:hypothetical protein
MGNRKSHNASYCLAVLIVTIFIAFLVPCAPAFAYSTWEFVSPMNVRRQMFGAALGDDGFIYAVGGFIWPEHITLSSVESYYPATGNWTFVAPLNTPRYGHGVIKSRDLIYAIGGTNGASVFDTMETYDVATDCWTVSPYSLNIPRKHPAVTTDHSGKIYAIGGTADDGSYLGSVEVFNPKKPWLGWHILEHEAAPIELNEPRSGLGSGTDKLGRIYAIAGDTNPFGVGETDTVERFDPSNPSAGWVYGPSLNQKRFVGAYATADDGRIYVLGGWAGGFGPHLSSVEVYDLATDSWQIHSNMNRSINNLAAAFDPSDKLYAIGGEHFNTQNQVERTQIYPPPIPIQLQWSTFHGGSNKDIGDGIAVDEDGNVYITGYTKSTDFATPGAYDISLGGEIDAYVSKFSADGTLLWSTYLGGTNYEEGRGIAVDSSGNVYVTGMTESADFPIQSGYDEDYNGGSDVFLSKFGADGALLWSTFLGGSDYDRGYDISCDASGNIYIVGYTNSTNFPTPNGYDTSHNGNYDAFVSKFSEDGSLLWSTYLGGANLEKGYGLDVDRKGNVYVTGETYSTDFPTLGGYDSSYNGNGDAFISKFSPSGNLLLSTYLGGSSGDVGSGVASDEGGNTYVTGWTQSSDFPTPKGYDTTYNGGDDAFVSRFSASGHLLWSTYLGGGNLDRAYELIMADRPRGIYVIGRTQSGDFPTMDAYDPSHNGSDDVFISRYGPSGSLLWSTYLGGSDWDEGSGIAADGSGDIYATGFTYSTDFPTPGGYDITLDGDCDAFVSKFKGIGTVNRSALFRETGY